MENLLLYLIAGVVFIAVIFQLIRIFRPGDREEKIKKEPVVEIIAIDRNEPVEIFAGTTFDCELVQSLLKNAEIDSYQFYGESGSMAPGLAPGNPPDRLMVAGEDYEKAKVVVDQFNESLKRQGTSDFDYNGESADNRMG